MNYNFNEHGYYGNFGGAYIPEMLYPNVEELRTEYLCLINELDFQTEFQQLLKDYVGRPSPLYFASRLSQKYDAKIYLKREDLNHTGAHKVNNTVGQILLAQRLGKNGSLPKPEPGNMGWLLPRLVR
jgi:tryptophan synthase beta chain